MADSGTQVNSDDEVYLNVVKIINPRVSLCVTKQEDSNSAAVEKETAMPNAIPTADDITELDAPLWTEKQIDEDNASASEGEDSCEDQEDDYLGFDPYLREFILDVAKDINNCKQLQDQDESGSSSSDESPHASTSGMEVDIDLNQVEMDSQSSIKEDLSDEGRDQYLSDDVDISCELDVEDIDVNIYMNEQVDNNRLQESTSEPSHDAGLLCEFCPQQFVKKENLIKHMSKYHPEKEDLICDLCLKQCVSSEELQKHVYLVHDATTEDLKFTSTNCMYCKAKFPDPYSLKKHIKIEHKLFSKTGKHIWSCVDCLKNFASRDALNKHAVKMHSYMDCKDCGSVFNGKIKLQKHIEKEHSVPTCNICGKIFMNAKAIEAHIASYHGGTECIICKQSFSNGRELKLHMKQLHSSTGNDIPENRVCLECGKVFTSEYRVLYHMNAIHGGRTCTICKATLTNQAELKKHLAAEHSVSNAEALELSSKVCKLCGKEFPSKRLLGNHVKTVHEKQTYKCEKCDRVFMSRQGFFYHKNSRHSKRFCTICNKEHDGLVSLKEHMKYDHNQIGLNSKYFNKK